MKASLTATLHSVTFTEKGAKVVLECSTTNALEAARQVSKMTGGAVQADFDDGQEPLFDDSKEQEPEGKYIPLPSLDIETGEIIDVPNVDDDLDMEVIEEVD